MKLRPEDLDKISNKVKSQMQLREDSSRVRVNVHMGTCGIASGARKILKAFLTEKETTASGDVAITTSGCAGLCGHEPMATIQIMQEAPVKYAHLTAEKVKRIYSEHILGGNVVTEYALARGSERVL